MCAIVTSAGIDKDGRPKYRAVDDFTRSLMNAATAASEKLRCDTLDIFHATLRESVARMGVCVAYCGVQRLRWAFCSFSKVGQSLWKADIDAAFRRIPIRPDHRPFGYICFLHKGRVVVAEHITMMFGSVASVHNWDRVGKCFLPHLLSCAACVGICQARCYVHSPGGYCGCLSTGTWTISLGRIVRDSSGGVGYCLM